MKRSPQDLNFTPARSWDWFIVRFFIAVMVFVAGYAFFSSPDLSEERHHFIISDSTGEVIAFKDSVRQRWNISEARRMEIEWCIPKIDTLVRNIPETDFFYFCIDVGFIPNPTVPVVEY